jgi:hypothetical protein
VTDISLGLLQKVIARMKTTHLPWLTQSGQNELLGKLQIIMSRGLRMTGEFIFLLLYFLTLLIATGNQARSPTDTLGGLIHHHRNIEEMTKTTTTRALFHRQTTGIVKTCESAMIAVHKTVTRP